MIRRFVGKIVVETQSFKPDLFNLLSAEDANESAAILNPRGDGSYGFWAVSLAVFGKEDEWKQVKQRMLSTLIARREVYETYGINITFFKDRLRTIKSPCLTSKGEYIWYVAFGCPQVTADTFNRAMVLFASHPKEFRLTGIAYDGDGNIIYNRDRTVFVPFFNIDPRHLLDPIVMLFANNYYYLLERRFYPQSKKRVDFGVQPIINPLHKFIMKRHGDVCPNNFSSYFVSSK